MELFVLAYQNSTRLQIELCHLAVLPCCYHLLQRGRVTRTSYSVTRFFSVCSYLRANYLVLSVQNNFSFCVHFLFLFVLIELLFHNNYDIIFVMYQIKYYLIIPLKRGIWPSRLFIFYFIH